jgi:mercuric ion transport protein
MMRRASLEKVGTTGAVIAALACPICFPKLALIGAALGLGIFAPYEGYIALGVQVLFVLALIGQLLGYRTHRNKWLVALAIATTATMFAAYYIVPSSILLEISLASLVGTSIWQAVEMKRCARCATAPPGTEMSAEHRP